MVVVCCGLPFPNRPREIHNTDCVVAVTQREVLLSILSGTRGLFVCAFQNSWRMMTMMIARPFLRRMRFVRFVSEKIGWIEKMIIAAVGRDWKRREKAKTVNDDRGAIDKEKKGEKLK